MPNKKKENGRSQNSNKQYATRMLRSRSFPNRRKNSATKRNFEGSPASERHQNQQKTYSVDVFSGKNVAEQKNVKTEQVWTFFGLKVLTTNHDIGTFVVFFYLPKFFENPPNCRNSASSFRV